MADRKVTPEQITPDNAFDYDPPQNIFDQLSEYILELIETLGLGPETGGDVILI